MFAVLKQKVTLHRFNNVLNVIAIVLAMYVLVSPFLPDIGWWVQHEAPLVSTPLTTKVNTDPTEQIPKENLLVIPGLGLREPINEGSDIRALDHGLWHRPETGTPQSSNMVLAGHRFGYRGQGAFYHLDKVKVGDEMTVYWRGEAYHYKVFAIKEVQANDTTVERATPARQLTLYTCTPLWSAKNRLVIYAEPLEVS